MGLLEKAKKLLKKKEAPKPKRPPVRPVAMLPVSSLVANKHAKDLAFVDEGLEEILEKYRRTGTLEPVVVRPLPDGKNLIVNGEGRWHAAKNLGLRELPCYVQGMRMAAEAPTVRIRPGERRHD